MTLPGQGVGRDQLQRASSHPSNSVMLCEYEVVIHFLLKLFYKSKSLESISYPATNTEASLSGETELPF